MGGDGCSSLEMLRGGLMVVDLVEDVCEEGDALGLDGLGDGVAVALGI